MAAQKNGAGPIAVNETPGKKAYCTCGWSARLPYCDGSHNRLNTGCQPTLCEVKEAGEKWVCQCHHTHTPPWCDSSHETLPGTKDAGDGI